MKIIIKNDYSDGDFAFESDAVLENVTVSNNYASHYGGGIGLWDHCSPTLRNVTISGNYAEPGNYSVGGGFWNMDGNPILENVTVFEKDGDEGLIAGKNGSYRQQLPVQEKV